MSSRDSTARATNRPLSRFRMPPSETAFGYLAGRPAVLTRRVIPSDRHDSCSAGTRWCIDLKSNSSGLSPPRGISQPRHTRPAHLIHRLAPLIFPWRSRPLFFLLLHKARRSAPLQSTPVCTPIPHPIGAIHIRRPGVFPPADGGAYSCCRTGDDL